jgi:three-Cys-motif partner protein
MNALIAGDDGLPAEEVGAWAKQKHNTLRRYVDVSRAGRNKFLTGRSKSAAFIDLFCGSGRALVKETGEWIDGSAVAAWKISQLGAAPFSEIYVADVDGDRRAATVERLRRLNAPVRELTGSAIEAAAQVVGEINRYGLHAAFIDPYSLGALDFEIIRSLSLVRRVDMMIHVSAMDLQRNLGSNLDPLVGGAFDRFAPGWRDDVSFDQSLPEIRRQVVEYWRDLVAALGKRPSTRMELITGSGGQRLYWLLLVAENDLAHRFWTVATDTGQGELF